ncbi:TolC family protein [Coraliomargarita algicola]|uniref:TolC family protein n=1 Tax=Coraliomargarita algicola TaxID=3092156 RepID=A0ABZ0RKH7_9BACT|nr:TolC family protein [Coraliomargarita sp. J2-16]WPJ95422.1 TolC family protein [Coraliomargarita sp. J2-16]
MKIPLSKYKNRLGPPPTNSPAPNGPRYGRTLLKYSARLLPCLLLAACASSPERSRAPEITLPDTWGRKVSDTTPTAWLKDFNSPQLEALVTEAMRHNPGLEATAARFAQSIAEARIAGADRMPQAGLGLNGTRQQISTFGPSSTGGVIFENYELALNLSWELDLWGRLRDRSSAARARAESSQAELHAARLSLAAQTTKAWLNVIEAQQQLALAQRTAQAYRNNQEALESRFKRGLTEGFDLRRIRTQAASAEADSATRQRALDQATRNLEVVLGRYPSGQFETLPNFPALPASVPAGLPAELLQRRPDLIAAERQLAAAEREQRAAQKERLPQISLTASGGSSSQEFENLLDGDFSVWSLAGNLTQPLFQGGRILANIDRTASLREQAAANYRDSALRAFFEVESTLAAEQYLRREQSKLALAAEEAAATETLAWERYRNGTGDFLSALDAQRTADSARSRQLGVSNLLLQNRIDLYLALGGEFADQPSAHTYDKNVGARLVTPAENKLAHRGRDKSRPYYL